MPEPILPQKLVDFIHGPVEFALGTLDAKLHPHGMFGFGILADGPSGRITILIPESVGARVLADLELRPRVTVVVGDPVGHETYQFKGTVVEVRPASAAEDAVQDVYGDKFMGISLQLGLPVDQWALPPLKPSRAVVMQVTDYFLQTPGPGAGGRIGP